MSRGGPHRDRQRGLRGGQDAVSDVAGSILLVAITVAMMGGLGLVVLNMEGPADPVRLVAGPSVHAGPDRQWGTADDVLRLTHKGGEGLPREGTTILVEVDGDLTRYTGADLDGGFADGQLTIGENWTLTRPLPLGARVAVDVAYGHGTTTVVADALLRVASTHPGACRFDELPPAVVAWRQDPADLNASMTGPVAVEADLGDDCAGVDPDAVPHLHFRLVGDPAPDFTDLGPMTHLTGHTWSGSIPDPTWSDHGGETLEYYLSGLRDLDNHTGDSSVRRTLVQLPGTHTFVTSHSAVIGTLTGFANMQRADDAYATLREAGTGNGTSQQDLDADGVTASSGWTDPENAFVSHDMYAMASGNAPAALRLTTADPASPSGTIAWVVLRAEVKASRSSSDWTLQACTSSCSDASAGLGSPTSDTVLSYNVTDLRPGGGAWDWNDLQDLEVVLQPSGTGNPTYSVDHVEVVVVVEGSQQRLHIGLDVEGVPGGTDHILDLRYRTLGDTFRVQAWNGTAWNGRATLDSPGGMRGLQVTLTAEERGTGHVQLRVLDNTVSSTQGELRIAHLRVVAS